MRTNAILLYMPTFARVQLHLPLDQAFIAQAIGLACMIVITPLSGALSDRIGRKPKSRELLRHCGRNRTEENSQQTTQYSLYGR
jgi:MFS family permease